MAAELRRALQEMQLGASRTQALRNLAARNDVLDLNTFIGAVVQSEEYGLPIANVLRIQASELRMRRKQRAEERALKIPVKIVFPLVVCIFPSLFIVLLGPAAVRVWRDVLS
jgi:tight adherence protein C